MLDSNEAGIQSNPIIDFNLNSFRSNSPMLSLALTDILHYDADCVIKCEKHSSALI